MGLDAHDVIQDGIFSGKCRLPVERYLHSRGKLGVRLEDDIVITGNGPINLMAKTPIEPDELIHHESLNYLKRSIFIQFFFFFLITLTCSILFLSSPADTEGRHFA